MSNHPMTHARDTEKLPQETVQLVAAVQRLSEADRQRIEPLLQKVIESTQRRKRILSLVQEALSQLRLDMKYLMFDLEATRRERDAYQRELEDGED